MSEDTANEDLERDERTGENEIVVVPGTIPVPG